MSHQQSSGTRNSALPPWGCMNPPSPACEDVHHSLAKGKYYMDHSWDFIAQTHVSELGGEGMFQEREKQGGLQAAVPSHSHCLAVRFPSQCQGSAVTFRPGAQGSAACRISQNDGRGERPMALLGCWGISWCQPAAQHQLCPDKRLAGLMASMGRCFYLNLSLCPVEMSKQTLCSSS